MESLRKETRQRAQLIGTESRKIKVEMKKKTLNKKILQMPVIPITQEAEAGKLHI